MSHAAHSHPPSETTGSRWTDAQWGLSVQSVVSTRRAGVAPPRFGARPDHAPGVEEEEEARSTRSFAVAPTPTTTRQGGHTSGPDLDAAEKEGPSHQEEEEETHLTSIKDAQTTLVGIADPSPGP